MKPTYIWIWFAVYIAVGVIILLLSRWKPKYRTNDKVTYKKPQPMTNQQLLEMFPKDDRIDMSVIESAIENVFTDVEHYQDVHTYMKRVCERFIPYPTDEQWREDDNQVVKDYMGFYFKDFRAFTVAVESEFVMRNGKRRTLREACEMAADEWIKRIFGDDPMDNGDTTGHSDMMLALGTEIKNNINKGVTKDIIEKARQLFIEYYEGRCMYTLSNGDRYQVELYSDYNPNNPLFDILVAAGLSESDAMHITPWKTGVSIDYIDNAVELIGYQKREYI